MKFPFDLKKDSYSKQTLFERNISKRKQSLFKTQFNHLSRVILLMLTCKNMKTKWMRHNVSVGAKDSRLTLYSRDHFPTSLGFTGLFLFFTIITNHSS